ncbi:ABC transporter permease [Cryptosporangium aurantiacum]|uniref:Transport permease protein n=1 Tax=Cryptosporangium aurantiacum TaxID=134849 RepID=A0A1M7RLH2_9ACTN|nr:ABC transporter permease [Cryptosporangium aurantiacum]SHN47147.1 ABC-2 type transport system permease protein [Cryptosporangium aurantiacum]
MSTLAHGLSDSTTMLKRTLRHTLRDPIWLGASIATPTLFLLLFRYLFGNAIAAGSGESGAYVDYVMPGILVLAIATSASATAVSVSADGAKGIIGRFRTMAIARTSVLTGHAVANVIRTGVSVVLVLAIGLLIGFRPSASVVEWLLTAGLLVLLSTAVSWLAITIGLAFSTPESANSMSLLIQFLPFLSSTFVPPESMSPGVRWFAEHQPYTPVIETVRGLLLGDTIGNQAWWAVGWCVGLALVGYFGARARFAR